jgi:N-methylhydantoinase B
MAMRCGAIRSAIEDDLREGKVTAEGAARDYGVVFAADGVSIDRDATTHRRAALAEART